MCIRDRDAFVCRSALSAPLARSAPSPDPRPHWPLSLPLPPPFLPVQVHSHSHTMTAQSLTASLSKLVNGDSPAVRRVPLDQFDPVFGSLIGASRQPDLGWPHSESRQESIARELTRPVSCSLSPPLPPPLVASPITLPHLAAHLSLGARTRQSSRRMPSAARSSTRPTSSSAPPTTCSKSTSVSPLPLLAPSRGSFLLPVTDAHMGPTCSPRSA